MANPPRRRIAELIAAAKSGRISQGRLDASLRRILQAKARLGLNKNRLVDISALNEKFAKTAWQETAQEISDRGVTLLRDKAHLLPLDGTKPTRALLVSLYSDPEPYPGEDLEAQLRARFDSLIALRADTKFVHADTLKLPSPDSYDIAILALFVEIRAVIIASIASALAWDYLFIPPRFAFTVGATEDQLLLMSYFIVIMIHAVFTYKIKEVQKEVRRFIGV